MGIELKEFSKTTAPLDPILSKFDADPSWVTENPVQMIGRTRQQREWKLNYEVLVQVVTFEISMTMRPSDSFAHPSLIANRNCCSGERYCPFTLLISVSGKGPGMHECRHRKGAFFTRHYQSNIDDTAGKTGDRVPLLWRPGHGDRPGALYYSGDIEYSCIRWTQGRLDPWDASLWLEEEIKQIAKCYLCNENWYREIVNYMDEHGTRVEMAPWNCDLPFRRSVQLKVFYI